MADYPQQDVDKCVLSLGGDPTDVLGTVVVKTLTNDIFVFPNTNVTKLKCVLPESGRIPDGMPSLVLVNASMATLIVPMQIIQKITNSKEILWEKHGRPANI